MENLSQNQKERLDECVQDVGGLLLATMKVFRLPNFIKATYQCGKDKYSLEFKKIKNTDKQ